VSELILVGVDGDRSDRPATARNRGARAVGDSRVHGDRGEARARVWAALWRPAMFLDAYLLCT